MPILLQFPTEIVGTLDYQGSWSDATGPVFASGSVEVPDGIDIALHVSPIAGSEPVPGGRQIFLRDAKVDLAFLRALPVDVVTSLNLDTYVDAVSLPHVEHLAPSLKSLVLQWMELDDDALTYIARLSKLTNLQTYGNRFTDQGVQALRALSQLEALYLEEETLTARAFDFVDSLPELRYLGLQDVQISDEQISDLRRRLPDVHVDR